MLRISYIGLTGLGTKDRHARISHIRVTLFHVVFLYSEYSTNKYFVLFYGCLYFFPIDLSMGKLSESGQRAIPSTGVLERGVDAY